MGLQGSVITTRDLVAVNQAAMQKALGDLERSIRDTKREAKATDTRVGEYEGQRSALATEAGALDEGIAQLQAQLESCKSALDAAQVEKAVVRPAT